MELLFAGSSTLAVARPTGEALSFIGYNLGGEAKMVGNQGYFLPHPIRSRWIQAIQKAELHGR